MTIKEMIEILKTMPMESIVVVDGYEGGYSDILCPKQIKLKLNVHLEDYYGPHEETSGADTEAVLIGRKPNPLSR